MKIYLASPSTQMHASAMAGMHVLESFALFATYKWMVRYRPTFAGMMLDSGAFTEMTTGKKVDLGAYIAFAKEHQKAYDDIVSLDVISGDVSERVERGLENLQAMRDAGIDAMPVFHQGEPWSVLTDLATTCGKIGLGLQRPMREIERFLDECFSRLPRGGDVGGGGVRVHGFALANERYTGVYPFHSVDSSTWAYEMKALMALSGQGSDVIQFLTPNEILKLVLLKYERMPKAYAWAGKANLDLPLFSED